MVKGEKEQNEGLNNVAVTQFWRIHQTPAMWSFMLIKHKGVDPWDGYIYEFSGALEETTASLQNGKRQLQVSLSSASRSGAAPTS